MLQTNSIRIKELDQVLEPAWTAYVNARAAGCVYHNLAWRNAIVRAYDHAPRYLMAVDDDGRVKGVLPLFKISRPLFGPILASDPFASYGGVVAEDEATAVQLMISAGQLGDRLGVRYVEIKNGTAWKMPPAPGWAIRTDLCSLEIALPSEAGRFWDSWRSQNRNYVNHALNKERLKVLKGHDLLDDLYRLIVLDMRRLGTPVHSRRFYEAIVQEYAENAGIWIAYAGDEPAAAMLALRDRHTVSTLVTVRSPGFAQSNAIRLLYWTLIEASCGRVAVLDMGRSARGSGTYVFKARLGATERPLAYCYKLIGSRQIPLLDQHNPSMQRYIRAWQRAPTFVTRLLGPRLIRYVP